MAGSIIWAGATAALLFSGGAILAQLDQRITPPEPLTAPTSWITQSDYPSGAVDRDETVEVSLRVGTNGRVSECWVRKRAQYGRFNELTCQLLTTRARFRPAHDSDGNRVTGDYRYSKHWSPPEPATASVFSN